MTHLQQALLDRIESLPPEKQQEVLDFAEFLTAKVTTQTPRPRIKGIWADLNLEITEADIADARQEMWGTFPKEEI